MKKTTAVGAALFGLLGPRWLWAADKAEPLAPNPELGPDAASMVQMLLGLVLVLGLIVGAGWLMRRMNMVGPGASGQLQVLSALAVGQKERVVLIQAGETQMLLGVAPGQVRKLHVFDEPIAAGGESRSAGFAGKLQTVLNRSQGQ